MVLFFLHFFLFFIFWCPPFDNSMTKVLANMPPAWAPTYQKLSRSSFANIMRFRATQTLEFVRVLSMHMGSIIFFIANAWLTRRHAPSRPSSTRPALCRTLSRCATWSVCHFARVTQKKRNEKVKKANPLWFLAITRQPRLSLATKHGIHGIRMEYTWYIWSYIYAHIARQRSATHIHFSNAFLMLSRWLPASLAQLLIPALTVRSSSFSFLVLRKFQPHTPYYAKCKAWRIDKINKYENLRQNFFVFWQFT